MKALLYVLSLMVLLLGCQSAPNRAAIAHRKAERQVKKGQFKKAKGQLAKAARLRPEKAGTYYTQAARIASQAGHFKQAMRFVEKVPCSVDECAKMDLARWYAWKGTVALQLLQREEAIDLSNEGLKLIKRYELDNDSLKSILFNNRGSAEIYHQGKSKNPKEDVNFQKIHKRDFIRAKRFFQQAVEANPNNCIAKYNIRVMEAILNVEEEHWENGLGYLADSIYPYINTPLFDCFPVEEKPSSSYSFGKLTKELIKKQEVLLVLDISGSMSSTVLTPDGDQKPIARIDMLKMACDTLLSAVDDKETKVGVITIGGSCGRVPLLSVSVGSQNAETINNKIQRLPLNGGTPLDERILNGMELFTKSKKSEKAILLFSDGIGACNRSYRGNICALGDLLKERGIQFYAFALLLEGYGKSSRAYGLLNCIVESTDGLLLGVDEENEVEDKTVELEQMPISIPLFIDEIRAGASNPYRQQDSLLVQPDLSIQK